jgi:hypothetical protein
VKAYAGILDQVGDLLETLVAEPREERRRTLAADLLSLVQGEQHSWEVALRFLEEELERAAERHHEVVGTW